MLKFPRKEEGKRNGRKGKDGNKGAEQRKEKGQNGAVCRERRIKCVRRNESDWLATRKEQIFFEPCTVMHQVVCNCAGSSFWCATSGKQE